MSGDKLSADARKRLGAMVETCDGFELAELDMKLRGAGDINGTQQSGMAFDLKIADLVRDNQIIEHTRRIAQEILADDPYLQKSENRLLATIIKRFAKGVGEDFSMIS
jgi:ATP-dependent DNA helicase RecG